MKRLIKILQEYKEKYPIEEKFNWEFPEDCPINIPNRLEDNYEKNIYLKENLYATLDNDSSLKSHYWVIQKWGGIGAFKCNENNDDKIRKFIKELNKQKLTKNSFGVISSFSKVASFLDYKSFVIYDSRVIYTLNWLLVKYTDEVELFPQPSGRNKELVQYDLNTITNLLDQKYTYKTSQKAYFEYCQLIKKLSSEIYEVEKPYKLEMLLFMLAPEVIVNDIKASIKVELTKSL